MKPQEIKKKARTKADATEPRSKVFDFVDKSEVAGSCTVTLPAERFSYIISRRVAENLLNTHKQNLPFDLWRPLHVSEEENWVEVTVEHLINGKLPPIWNTIEIWMPAIDDIDSDHYRSPGAK